MDILFSKQAKKYIEACDKPTKQRLKTAIMAIPSGDIKKLKGYDNWYPEDIPERDEVEAIQQAMSDNSPKYTFDAVNWD